MTRAADISISCKASRRESPHRRPVRRPCSRGEHRPLQAEPNRAAAWIPVGEELPRDEGFVLAFVSSSGQACIANTYWDGKAFWEHDWAWTPKDVSHWMRLPAPPPATAQENVLRSALATAEDCEEGGEVGEPAPQATRAEAKPLFRRIGLLRWIVIPMIWVLAAMAYPTAGGKSCTAYVAGRIKQQITPVMRAKAPARGGESPIAQAAIPESQPESGPGAAITEVEKRICK